MQIQNTMDAVLDENRVEIDQKAQGEAQQLQVCDNLRLVDGSELFDCLKLDQKPLLEDYVRAESDLDHFPFVVEWHRQLPLIFDAAQIKLMSEAAFVGGLQKAGTKLFVDGKRCVNSNRSHSFDVLWDYYLSHGFPLFLCCSFVFYQSGGRVMDI